jgi:integrase
VPLTDYAVKNAKPNGKPYKLTDFDGLYLYVSAQGSRLWRYDYRFGGKRKTASFGVYPDIGLAAARQARDTARQMLKDGRDPIAVRQVEKARINGTVENSFETVARNWFAARKATWRADHAAEIMRRLETFIFPDLGPRAIGEIEPPELLAVLRKVERRPAIVTARKCSQTCGQIFRFAIAEGKAMRDPSRDIAGALTSRPVTHRSFLKAAELPEFFARLDDWAGPEQHRLALELILLCLTRASETCAAEWSEIENLDGANPLWRVPANRMKMNREHLIPLTPRAVVILRRLRELAGDSQYVLAAATSTGYIWRQYLINAMYELSYQGDATVHGFRRTASTILHEKGYHPDWIELALAHKIAGVRGIYNAAAYLEQRRKMLMWWDKYLAGCRKVGALVGR